MTTMKKRMGVLTASLALLGFGLASTPTEADAQQRRNRRGKAIQIDVFVIEGTIQKPQAFYILQRSSLNLEGLELKNSFVPKIIKSVEEAPF